MRLTWPTWLGLLCIALFIGILRLAGEESGGWPFILIPIALVLFVLGKALARRAAKDEYAEKGHLRSTTGGETNPTRQLALGIFLLGAAIGLASLFISLDAKPRVLAFFWPVVLGLWSTRVLLNLWIKRFMKTVGVEPRQVEGLGHPGPVDADPSGQEHVAVQVIADPSANSADPSSVAPARASGPLPSPRLLLLWNFDRQLGATREAGLWRAFGPVYLLQGPAGLPMLRFLKLRLLGRLEEAFITSSRQVDAMLASGGERAKRWGLHRLYSFVCAGSAWQEVVDRLLAHVDGVIMDARSFTRERDGLSWELARLVHTVPADRCLIVADSTTDIGLAKARLEAAGQDLAPDSPNFKGARGRFRILDLSGGRPVEEDPRMGIRPLNPVPLAPLILQMEPREANQIYRGGLFWIYARVAAAAVAFAALVLLEQLIS